MIQGLFLYNERKYWECHEVLEDLWAEDTSDNARYVYWAIIQVATALYHYENQNLVGAWGMLYKSKDKFEKCRTLKVEVIMMEEYLKWNTLKEIVANINKGCSLLDFDRLYNFKFPLHKNKTEVFDA